MTLARTTKRRRTRQRAKYLKLHPPKAGATFQGQRFIIAAALEQVERNLTVARLMNRDYR